MNEDELNYCRVDTWRAAGYTGTGIKVAIHEVSTSNCSNLARWGGKVLDPFGEKFDGTLDTHAQRVIDTLLTVAPGVEVHLMGSDWMRNLQYCIDNGIDLYNYSATGSYSTDEFNALEQKALDAGVVFVCCAGNDGAQADSLTGFSRKKTWLSVGAVRWGMDYYGEQKPLPMGYSSWDSSGDDLDVMGFSDGLQIPSELSENKLMGVTGTSFSCPWVVGLLALWKQKFIAANKRKPTFSETFKYAISNAQDIEAAGYDQKTGHGVVRLSLEPVYDTIEVWIGNRIAEHNDVPFTLNIAPQVISGYTMVGLRDIATMFGASVAWDQVEKKVTIRREI